MNVVYNNMNIESQSSLAVESLSLGVWHKQFSVQQSDEPSPRMYHSAAVHKGNLYVYGGVFKEKPLDQTESNTVYRYNFNNKNWNKHMTNFLSSNSFSFIYGHATTVYNNMMYMFGGRNQITGHYVNGLWGLNLESFNWKRQEGKGYCPTTRYHSVMTLHQRNTLILYGGRYEEENLNDMYLYKIDTKTWLQIEPSSFSMKVPCRLKPALCSQGDYLYLFGGERRIIDGTLPTNTLLNDFYQLKLINRPMSTRPDVWVKQIITNYSPAPSAGNLLNINDKYLALWGSENREKRQYGFWLYVIGDINWLWVNVPCQKVPMSLLPGYSINFIPFSSSKQVDKIYIFGANNPPSQSCLSIISLDSKDLEQKLKNNQYRPKPSISNKCWQCNQLKLSLEQLKFNEFSILEQMLEDEMIFPFSALGLLIDNSLILGSKDTRIVFGHASKEKYILIEDNGVGSKLWSHNNDFINDFIVMRTYVEESIDQLEKEEQVKEDQGKEKKNFMPPQNSHHPHHPTNILNKETKEMKEQKEKEAKDKEMEKELKKRKRQAKEKDRRKKENRIQYSRNVKLGSLRLGNRFLFIGRYGQILENRRVFVIERSELSPGQSSFRVYYYIYQNGKIIDAQMENARKYIDEEYKNYFKIASDRKQSHNFLFISQLREKENNRGEKQPELKQSLKHLDIFNCDLRQLQNLEDGLLFDCIDVSLKTYLSLLYLKSDQIKITLCVGEQKPQEISNSDIFDRIDSLVKSEKLLDLQPCLDLSNCSIIQAYYNQSNLKGKEPGRKPFNFLNGVLFYHKNRMISRFRYSLGEVASLFKNKMKNIQQELMMFGFIEIKEQFAINIFKTAFVRDDLLEEIYHRLKFVEKYVQKMTYEQSRRPAEEHNEPKKRFKSNQEEGSMVN